MAKKTSTPKPAATASKPSRTSTTRSTSTTKRSTTTSKKTGASKATTARKKSTSTARKKTATTKKTTATKARSTVAKSKSTVKKTVAAEKLPDFLGLPGKYSNRGNAKVCIVPVPYEATTSYGKGTAGGPRAILEASQEVELFDDELWAEPFKVGVHTTGQVDIKPVKNDALKPFDELHDVVKPLIDIDKFPIILGGEHSLSLGAVKACLSRYKDLSILQVDAHCDLRNEYEENQYSHASVSRRMYEAMPKPLITQVGIRNVSKEEVAWMEEKHPNINIFWARNQDKWNFQNIVNTLSDNVYLTIDVDGLDSGIMPSTGTPEPGGIDWYRLMELIKLVCVRKNVVAADIVELSPIEGLHAPDFLTAKLIYKLIGYRFALDIGVTKRYV